MSRNIFFAGDFRRVDCDPKPKHRCDDDDRCRKPKRRHHEEHCRPRGCR